MTTIRTRMLTAINSDDPLDAIRDLAAVASAEDNMVPEQFWDAATVWLACYIKQEKPGDKALIDLFSRVHNEYILHTLKN